MMKLNPKTGLWMTERESLCSFFPVGWHGYSSSAGGSLPPPPGFPIVQATNTSTLNTNGTSHTVNLPSSIVAQDLLIVIFCNDGNSTVTWPAGWTEIFETANGTAANLAIAWAEADGTEGATITVTTSASQKSAHNSYRISNARSPNNKPPQISAGATGTSAIPDSDAITPIGVDAKKYLFITCEGHDSLTTTTAFPTNYSPGIQAQSTGTGPAGCSSARRLLDATTDNPGTFTISGSSAWISATIVVYPAVNETFPVVEGTTQSTEDANVTSHTVDLPVNIVAGELLLVFFSNDGGSTVTWPGDWTEFFESANGTANNFAIAWHEADGSEGATITVTSSATQKSAHNSYRISGAQNPTDQPPEVSTAASGDSSNPDPGTVTPTGGSRKYLFIAAAGMDGTATATSPPTDYVNLLTIAAAPTAAAGVASAERLLEASSDNPGTFTNGFTEQWVAATVSVHPFSANGVNFGGVNEFIERVGDLTGSADSKLFTASFWFQKDQLGTQFILIANSPDGFDGYEIRITTSNLITIQGQNVGSSIILDIESSAIADGNWHHVLVSVNMAISSDKHLYIDDVSDFNQTTFTDDTIDFTRGDHSIGARDAGAVKFNGGLADVWVGHGIFIDFSIIANRRKFIDAAGRPVFLGSDGSAPTGTAPRMFFSGPTSTWHTNDGSGGGFTEQGTLGTRGTGPSD